MYYLRAIIDYFHPSYICRHAEELLEEIKKFELEDRLELVRSLGISLIKAKPRGSKLKLAYLNYGWE